MSERKPKACAICQGDFYPLKSTERVCSIDCAIEFAQQKKEKRRKQEIRALRREFNRRDRGYQMKHAQIAFNAYIRARDAGNGCISCGKNSGAKMNAGHYLSTGAHPELRFAESNCHLQCEWCNSYLSGNIARYRINLIEKIGLEKVEWLEGPHEPAKLSIDDIIAIKEKYREKLKGLKVD